MSFGKRQIHIDLRQLLVVTSEKHTISGGDGYDIVFCGQYFRHRTGRELLLLVVRSTCAKTGVSTLPLKSVRLTGLLD